MVELSERELVVGSSRARGEKGGKAAVSARTPNLYYLSWTAYCERCVVAAELAYYRGADRGRLSRRLKCTHILASVRLSSDDVRAARFAACLITACLFSRTRVRACRPLPASFLYVSCSRLLKSKRTT